MALEYATIPAYSLPSVDAVGASLYEALEAAGHLPGRAPQRLRAIAFTPQPADVLGLAPGPPGRFIERPGFLPVGRPDQQTTSHYRGSAYDGLAEMHGKTAKLAKKTTHHP